MFKAKIITAMSFSCGHEILYTVLGTICAYSFLLVVLIITYKLTHKKKKRKNKAATQPTKDIEGRRNIVYENDNDQKDDLDDEIRHERKRQDSGFIASSNESIVPFPGNYHDAPQRSPSMPNLPTRSHNERVGTDEDVFNSAVNLNEPINLKTSVDLHNASKHVIVSVEDAETQTQDGNLAMTLISRSTDKSQSLRRKLEIVTLEKKSFNCTGLDFGIAGIYVRDIDTNEITVTKGNLNPGDEVISINDFPLNGLSDMEAFSFFAKSGPDVKLKIIKGGFLSKVENSSISSEAYALSETSEIVDELNISTIPFETNVNLKEKERLPRVIADANNLSLDLTTQPQPQPVCNCNQDRVQTDQIFPQFIPSSSQYSFKNAYCDIQQQITSDQRPLFTTRPYDQAIQKSTDLRRNGNSLTSDHNRHSRHTSAEQSHSRHSSNEHNRHSRNSSHEKNREHNRHSSDEQERSYHFTRAQSEEVLKSIAVANGLLQRSASGDNSLLPFTVESVARRSDGIDGQLYYQELLRQRNLSAGPEENPQGQSLAAMLTEKYPQVTQALLSDNVVVQRGYNNDYIVPISSAHTPTNLYSAKSTGRARDSSPSRRTSPQLVTPSQINPRYPQFSMSPLAVSAANASRTMSNGIPSNSSSPNSLNSQLLPQGGNPLLTQGNNPQLVSVNGVQAENHRKPPPEYFSVKRQHEHAEYETLPSPFTNEKIEIDADVMRYMTKKYSEPRFTNGYRKDPPPYSSSHATLSIPAHYGSVETIDHSPKPSVILKRSATSASEIAGRSRPHSLPGSDATDLTNIYTKEKRNQPKRTHSLPAVKHLEMRPRAAKAFLNVDNVDEPPVVISPAEMQKKSSQRKLRQKQRLDSINRRKSIDAGTLKKLAEEIQINPSLEGEYPIIAQLLGESQYSASERRTQPLYRHKSTEALTSQF